MVFLLPFLLVVLVALAVLLRRKEWMWKTRRYLWSLRNEWLAVPLAGLLFVLSSGMLRAFDPQAGVFDVGVLQVLFVSAIYLFVAMTTAQVATAISYRRLFNPQRTKPVCRTDYVALYALYFLGCVVLMASL